MIRTVIIISVFIANFCASSSGQNTDFLIDERDGNMYLVAKFNDTWWMCQNLKYDAGEGSACYDDKDTKCMLEGRLYNHSSALKACPEGYSLPGDEEWKALESYIGMPEDELDGNYMRNSGQVGKYLKVGGGIGFDAILAGIINLDGKSLQTGLKAYFWSSSEDANKGVWARIISKNSDGVERKTIDPGYKLSVRCVKKAQADSN